MEETQKPKARYRKRQIAHESFHNVDCRHALNLLKDADVGEAVFRPSSLGTDHLTLSWKMSDKIYRHYDIKEEQKASDRRLGSKLVLKDETYEDLDEILARYISPMNDLVEDVRNHPKFRDQPRNDIFKELGELKQQNPKSFPYAMYFSTEHPGCVVITYVTNKTPRNLYAQFGPNGLRFFGKISSKPLSRINDALNFFKKAVMKMMKSENPSVHVRSHQSRSSKSRSSPADRYGPSSRRSRPESRRMDYRRR